MTSSFTVFYSNKAKKFIQKKADAKLRQRLLDLVGVLEESPVPSRAYDVRKLEGQDEFYRIRLSSYRVIYRVKWEEKEVDVLEIERRDEATYK